MSVRRPVAGQLPSRTNVALRRRIVLGVLVLVSLALITVSFREGEGGPLRSAQDAAATALMPFEVAVERVARPFRDAWAWFDGLLGAKDEAERLRKQNEALLQQVVQYQFAANEAGRLKALLEFKQGPTFPGDFEGIAAAVTSRPPVAYAQEIVVAVGASHGVEKFAPVVTDKGLVGVVVTVYTRSSRVRLLTDEQSSVSAKDARTGAAGIVRHGPGVGATLSMERVPKENRVRVGDTIVTAGWRSSRLESIYPPGIPIGRVTSVGQTNTDLYKQVQVEPLGDFTSLDAVLVLVPKEQP